MTRGTNHCKHRRPSEIQKLQRSHSTNNISTNLHGLPAEDLRVRLLNNNNNVNNNYAKNLERRHGSLATPAANTAKMRRTNSSLDKTSIGTTNSFSVTAGLGQCMSQAAVSSIKVVIIVEVLFIPHYVDYLLFITL